MIRLFKETRGKRATQKNKRRRNARKFKPSTSGSPGARTVERVSGRYFSLPPMHYEDVIEASRLAEEVVQGHDISHMYSSSQAAKNYVLEFSKLHSGKRSAEILYNNINRRLVKMNRIVNTPTSDYQKLYQELMTGDIQVK